MIGRLLGRFVVMLFLLVIEVFLTMLVYTYLNLNYLNAFGYLVRMASTVHEAMKSALVAMFPGSVNAAYATLFGELGPKAILLLLIGLVVAAVVRGLVELMGLFGYSRH